MAPAKKKQRLSEGGSATVDERHEDTTNGNSSNPAATGSAAAEESKTATQQRRSLFVRSLPADTTSESLTALFSDSYPIKHATAVTDPATKQCRGYGFVTFADSADAARARDEFNGHVLDGRKLRVEIAEPRHRDGDGSTAVGGGPTATVGATTAAHAPLPTKLIVRNMPWSIKHPDQLSKLFMSYGKVKQAYIPKKGPGLMAGFGFVVMRGRKNAEKAIEGINGRDVDGRTLAVDWAVEKGVYEGVVNGEAERLEPENEDVSDGLSEDGVERSDHGSDSDDGAEDVSVGSHESGEDLSDDEDAIDSGEDAPQRQHQPEDRSCTLFVRNLPFSCMDEDLEDHFSQFGSIRYARVVMDHATERSKGTGFVCFYKKEDADACLREAPRQTDIASMQKPNTDSKNIQSSHSILQNDESDPSGNYTLDGRVLHVSRAVEKAEANRLTEEGTVRRNRRDNDKRRLYLLSEGTISSKSKLWESLSTSEKAMRDASAKQRKTLIEANPSLHLSLTRLSVRNIPRSIGSKELKALARDAIVGFASDVKAGRREKLSREELARGGEDMHKAELARKRSGRGVVKQTKVVYESASGSKVGEDSGAGRSRGYGFIEYHTHRNALMGLRWLNGHSLEYSVQQSQSKASRDDNQDRKKRLIVEFAIENAQVVMRRKEREEKARGKSETPRTSKVDRSDAGTKVRQPGKQGSRKRKREASSADSSTSKVLAPESKNTDVLASARGEDRQSKRNQIIGRKRAMRRARKAPGA